MARCLRPDIHGGISECRSPEDRIGYGRCTHLPGNENISEIVYDKSTRCNYVEVKTSNSPDVINKNKSEIKTFIGKVKKAGFSGERAREIIKKIV